MQKSTDGFFQHPFRKDRAAQLPPPPRPPPPSPPLPLPPPAHLRCCSTPTAPPTGTIFGVPFPRLLLLWLAWRQQRQRPSSWSGGHEQLSPGHHGRVSQRQRAHQGGQPGDHPGQRLLPRRLHEHHQLPQAARGRHDVCGQRRKVAQQRRRQRPERAGHGSGQQRRGVPAGDHRRPLHGGLRLPAGRPDGHRHRLPHLRHRRHRRSHHADLLWRSTGVCRQVFHQGAVVTDVARCTALGRDVLGKLGSSVDAAIAAALCLGVVHPHTSGLGGGGVMLVHNSRKNETRVIDFRETAPSVLQEEMLYTNLDLKPGLLVGVPGMLSGMHQAHQLYGRMPWKDVVTMAADVAREGFNVTHDLAEALAKVEAANVSASFRELFLPGGQPPLPGLLSRRLDLAAVLDAVADQGISAFYSGNLTREMTAAVHAGGGVVVEEDFANYSSVLQQPAEVTYQGHHVMAAPAPHAGVALVTALNILEGFNISSQMSRNGTYHWIAEAVKIALGLASELGDPAHDSSVSDIVSKMLSKSEASALRQMINDTQAFPADHYTPTFSLQGGATAAQVMVMGPDDIIVSIMSSLNRPFGSGIVTPSGVLLNSQILDFSWPNKTENFSPNPHNSIQRGKRPMSFLMPTAVRPALGVCGTYLAVGSSNADKALSAITQVLLNVLSLRINMSESLAFGRLHPQLQPDTLLVDAEFLEEDVELLQAKGHKVERLELLSVVDGTRRTNDLITGTNDPRSVDASALILSKTP